MKAFLVSLALIISGCAQTAYIDIDATGHGIGTYSQGAGTKQGDLYGNTEGSGGQQ